jgi:hypothetical protein
MPYTGGMTEGGEEALPLIYPEKPQPPFLKGTHDQRF